MMFGCIRSVDCSSRIARIFSWHFENPIGSYFSKACVYFPILPHSSRGARNLSETCQSSWWKGLSNLFCCNCNKLLNWSVGCSHSNSNCYKELCSEIRWTCAWSGLLYLLLQLFYAIGCRSWSVTRESETSCWKIIRVNKITLIYHVWNVPEFKIQVHRSYGFSS